MICGRDDPKGECKLYASNGYSLGLAVGKKKKLVLILCTYTLRHTSHFPKNRLKKRTAILKGSNLTKVIHGISTIELNVNIYDCICSGYSGAIITVLNENVKWTFI